MRALLAVAIAIALLLTLAQPAEAQTVRRINVVAQNLIEMPADQLGYLLIATGSAIVAAWVFGGMYVRLFIATFFITIAAAGLIGWLMTPVK